VNIAPLRRPFSPLFPARPERLRGVSIADTREDNTLHALIDEGINDLATQFA
jgi:hypothetical protein